MFKNGLILEGTTEKYHYLALKSIKNSVFEFRNILLNTVVKI